MPGLSKEDSRGEQLHGLNDHDSADATAKNARNGGTAIGFPHVSV